MSFARYHDELARVMSRHRGKTFEAKDIKSLFEEAYPTLDSDWALPSDHCIDHTNKGACDCALTGRAIFSRPKYNTYIVRPLPSSSKSKASTMKQWHVAVAAEAFVAALFARCGCDVFVQYGANLPEYDLSIKRENKKVLVSVKGSQDGSWGLTQSYLEKADYHGAVDTWLSRHDPGTLFCLVQFKSVPIEAMPRVYLAWPHEIAQRLRETALGRGDTILYEKKVWAKRAYAAGTVDQIPDAWAFSRQRLDQIFGEV